jgi:hypothetical protein
VHTQDGGEPVKARILIGADGYRSRIRAQLRSDDPEPEFQDCVMWRARVPFNPSGVIMKESTCGPLLPSLSLAPSLFFSLLSFSLSPSVSACLSVSLAVTHAGPQGGAYTRAHTDREREREREI